MDEKQFTQNIIDRLEGDDWIEGDDEKEMLYKKSADIVNHKLKIAIEIKDDLSQPDEHPIPGGEIVGNHHDLGTMMNRYKSDIRDANKKFRNYENYETVVLIRHEYNRIPIKNLLCGLIRLGPNGRVGNKDVNITRSSESCALYAFYDVRTDELEWYKNPVSKRGHKILLELIANIFPRNKEFTY